MMDTQENTNNVRYAKNMLLLSVLLSLVTFSAFASSVVSPEVDFVSPEESSAWRSHMSKVDSKKSQQWYADDIIKIYNMCILLPFSFSVFLESNTFSTRIFWSAPWRKWLLSWSRSTSAATKRRDRRHAIEIISTFMIAKGDGEGG